MSGYLFASLAAGVMFIILDMLINVNPLALRLHKAYQPIAREAQGPFY